MFPKGDARDPDVLAAFVAAVHSVAPDATGTPVTIQEAGRSDQLVLCRGRDHRGRGDHGPARRVLRRPRDVALVFAPLLLAAILTLAVTVSPASPLNYANIIALPLLLGIGVAFDIYFVMNWRAGQSRHLQSSTARAVVFSALTTMSRLRQPGAIERPRTAGMGELLTLSLACTLFCTLLVLPALLGPARGAATGAAGTRRQAAPAGQPAAPDRRRPPGHPQFVDPPPHLRAQQRRQLLGVAVAGHRGGEAASSSSPGGSRSR